MFCDSYDCRSTLMTQSTIENRIYKVVPGNTDFEKPEQSITVAYHEAGMQDHSDDTLEPFSFYLKNTNTPHCRLNTCLLLENCNSSIPLPQEPSTNNIWGITSTEITAMS